MLILDFNKRIDNAVKAGHYLEAFAIKSLFIEGVITALSTAILSHERGYDGKEKNLVQAVEVDPDERKFFETIISMKLSEKIKVLRKSDLIKDDKQADYLYTWKDKYRDTIFHNFGELVFHPGEPDAKSKEGYEFMTRFTSEDWFRRLEESFIKVEAQLAENDTFNNL